MSTNGIALICGDGAVKGGFIAGAVTALQNHFPEAMDNLSTVAATSASVGSMFYFMSHGKNHPGFKVWTEELASKNFINFKGIKSFYSEYPLYDLHYMADTVFKERNPLNIENVLSSDTEFYVSVQRYDSQKLEYFSNRPPTSFSRDGEEIAIHNMSSVDPYELIKATNSAPFVFDQTITLNGIEYIDAATLEPFILDLPALKGKKRIVIITKNRKRVNRTADYVLTGRAWPFFVNPFKKRKLENEIYFQYAKKPKIMRRLALELDILERYDRTVVIAPEFRLGSITDNSPETLQKNYQHGIDVVERLLEKIDLVVQS